MIILYALMMLFSNILILFILFTKWKKNYKNLDDELTWSAELCMTRSLMTSFSIFMSMIATVLCSAQMFYFADSRFFN